MRSRHRSVEGGFDRNQISLGEGGHKLRHVTLDLGVRSAQIGLEVLKKVPDRPAVDLGPDSPPCRVKSVVIASVQMEHNCSFLQLSEYDSATWPYEASWIHEFSLLPAIPHYSNQQNQ